MKKILSYFILTLFLIIVLAMFNFGNEQNLKNNVKKSADILYSEGEYCSKNIFGEFSIDNYTDAEMINECISFDKSHPVESFLLVRRNYIPGKTNEIKKDIVR